MMELVAICCELQEELKRNHPHIHIRKKLDAEKHDYRLWVGHTNNTIIVNLLSIGIQVMPLGLWRDERLFRYEEPDCIERVLKYIEVLLRHAR